MQKILIILTLCLCTLSLVEGQTYKVGDLYTAPDGSKGIVYYLHPDGSGGWVVALNDASSGCSWGTSVDVPGLTNLESTYRQNLMSDTAGYAHTRVLRNYQNNNTNYAAGKVDFANGWVLPAPGQLATLYGQLPLIASALTSAGGTTLSNAYYWTSAERMSSSAWLVDFGEFNNSGTISSNTKTYSYRVRAVRSFTYESYVDLHYVWNTGDTTPDITVSPAQTTTYTVTVFSTIGGSDTVEKTIVVGEPSSSEFTVFSEIPYTWNGIVYSHSGDYTQTFTNAVGCDSIVTLHLTVDIPLDMVIIPSASTICEGESVMLQAQTAPQPVAVGDIICTDGTFVKYKEWPMEGKTAKGVVFYVDNTGEHGWAVHLEDQSTGGVAWGDYTYDIPTLQNYSYSRNVIYDLNGYSNTEKIRSTGDANSYPAAYLVDFENGWYLPAIGQLRILFSNYSTVNYSISAAGGTSFQTDIYTDYLSSTENNESVVWRLHGGGDLTLTGKSYTGVKIRSVRSF